MTQWEINQANLDRLAKPIDDYSDKRLALTLSDIANDRSQREEIAREGRSEVRQTKRDKELEARIRRQKILDLASKGIKLPAEATDEQVADAEQAFMRKRANATIGIIRSEKEGNDLEQEKVYSEYMKSVSVSATPEQKKQALTAALANPALTQVLNEKQMNSLRASLASGDPEKAIADVAKSVGGDYWFFKGKNPAKAQAILDAFQVPLYESLDESKKMSATALLLKFKGLEDESRSIQKNLFQAAREHAAFIDPEMMAKIQFGNQPPISDPPMAPLSAAAPEDPNSVFGGPPQERDALKSEKWSGSIATKTRPAIEAVTERFVPGVGAYVHNIQTGVGNLGRKLFTGSPQKPELDLASVMSGGAGIGALEKNAMPANEQDFINHAKMVLDSQPDEIKKMMKYNAVMEYGVDKVNEAQDAIENPNHPYHSEAIARSYQELRRFFRKRNGLPDVAPVGDDLSAP